MRILLFAPIHNSLYARLIAKSILDDSQLELCGIVVRSHFNFKRFRSEFRRDGPRFLRKILEKLIIGDDRFEDPTNENLRKYAEDIGLEFKSLYEVSRQADISLTTVKDLNSPDSQAFIREQNPEVIVFTGGGLIRKRMLEIPSTGVINCHSGILPEYRGMDVVEWTAVEGENASTGFGATQHLMDSGVDTGPILQKDTLMLHENDTFKTIRERIEVLMVQLMLSGLQELRDGNITPKLQQREAGRQYYVMHPRIHQFAEKKLRKSLELKS